MTDTGHNTSAQTAASSSQVKRLLPLIIFGLVVIVPSAFVIYRQNIGTLNIRDVPSPLIGKHVPKFSLPLLNGEGRFDDTQFNGKITLLNIWASWCYVCRLEHAEITRLSQQGIRVVGLNYKDEPADAKSWLQQLGNPYEEVIADIDGRVGIDFGVYGAPETFVIDQNGIIRDKRIGEVNERYVEEKLMPLLNIMRSEAGAPAT